MDLPTDIKTSNMDMDSEKGAAPAQAPPPRNLRRTWAFGFLTVCTLYFLLFNLHPNAAFPVKLPFKPCATDGVAHEGIQTEIGDDFRQLKTLVPLEAHIMSKCPDAKVGCTRSLRKLWINQ
jgi:hypothetical protein